MQLLSLVFLGCHHVSIMFISTRKCELDTLAMNFNEREKHLGSCYLRFEKLIF
uniref:Uncharacterized protein n=1 Tax=Nelumbo nucifera TaxID=4432 RepID=A0A822XMC4_NELNU|nr:TPA_asm: hypothetical protein HUJ06_024207 [Nelumbo nucifera]